MGIYTYPDGVIDQLLVKGPALFDVSVYFTKVIQAAAGANFDGTINLGNASGDSVGFYKAAGVTQAASIPDLTTTDSDTTENVAILQSILNVLEGVGLVAT